LMAAGGSQVPATGNIGHWNEVVGEAGNQLNNKNCDCEKK